jgi:carbamoyltransferase
MSSIYGFYGGSHSSTVSLVVDGKIICCLEEERTSRIKSGDDHESLPLTCSKKIEQYTGFKIKDVDHRIWSLPCPDKEAREICENMSYEKISHHVAHNYGAYFTSGFEGKVISVSYDGGGETSFMKVFLCENGKMTEVLNLPIPYNGSLSHLWGFSTTTINGYDKDFLSIWKICKDEGKLMGMAPEGRYDERIYRILNSLIDYKDFKFFPTNTGHRTKFVTISMFENGEFNTPRKKEIFSYNLQKLTEDLMLKFFTDLQQRFPEYKKLVLSGGLFANVKLNQKINESDLFDELYVYPAMGDEGLSLGSAIYKAVQLGEITHPFKMPNFYLGTSYTEKDIQNELKIFNFEREVFTPESIAQDIFDGLIIGTFDGKMEFGPRALGNRSILTRPTEKETHSKLNERLGRYDTMPFAPMILSDYFDEVFTSNKSKYSSEFMTLCYTTKDDWIDKIPAVIQKSDKTARPQIVTEQSNPMIYQLMKRYYELSSIPLILNTSFNIHNEPILEHPLNAFEHLKNGVVDKLIFDGYVYKNR